MANSLRYLSRLHPYIRSSCDEFVALAHWQSTIVNPQRLILSFHLCGDFLLYSFAVLFFSNIAGQYQSAVTCWMQANFWPQREAELLAG